MSEFLRNNWFVVVIAVIIIAFVSYFIYDENKYNVSAKSDSDGNQVVASLDKKDITANDIYDQSSPFDTALLYNLYHNQVVDQSIKTTDKLDEKAKDLEQTIKQNASSSSSQNTESQIESELASFGYNGMDQLYDYCLMTVKEAQMQRDYIEDHFDELTPALQEKKPRTISIISMQVQDLSALTEDEQKKKDNIDSALASGSFADAATAYSEDTSTASNDGFYGYVDSDSTSSQYNTLNAQVIQAALNLDKDQTSDWIEVTDSSSGLKYLYKVHVDETDIQKIWDSKNETVSNNILSAFLNANNGLSVKIVQDNAKDLDIEFKDKDVQKRVEDYINNLTGGSSDEE